MPELPEVETTRRGIAPHVTGQIITGVSVRERRLRWPVPADLEVNLTGRKITTVRRRAKYLLLSTDTGTVLLHLGMSGHLRVIPAETPAQKHDHVDFEWAGGLCLRFNDPRRFGAILWTPDPPERHPLLARLGPEPLSEAFGADYLYDLSRYRTIPVKSLIMDSHAVVGVGNIYANEALFRAGIHPQRAAGRISRRRHEALIAAIREVLTEAIDQGGTTLRDFVSSTGQPGYFSQRRNVDGRAGLPGPNCGTPIKLNHTGQRATYYCSYCQR